MVPIHHTLVSLMVPAVMTTCTYFFFQQYGWISVVCDVTIKQGVRKVTIHSGLQVIVKIKYTLFCCLYQIKNELPVLVTVYTKDRPHSPAEKIGEIDRDKIFHVPLNVLAKKQELTFGVG